MEIATKFAQHEISPLENLKNSKIYQLREKLNTGEKLTREEKNYITEKLNSNSFFKSSVPLMGWRFDFSDVVKSFLVKQYDRWSEYKAIDKTSLRECIYGRIDKIVEA